MLAIMHSQFWDGEEGGGGEPEAGSGGGAYPQWQAAVVATFSLLFVLVVG